MMRFLLFPSIARRVFIAVVFACALVWLGVYALGQYEVLRSESGNFDQAMLRLTDAIAILATDAPDDASFQRALAGIEAYLETDWRVNESSYRFLAFQVWRADGYRVAHSSNAFTQYWRKPRAEGFSEVAIGAEAYRIYGRTVGRYHIEVTQSLHSRQLVFDAVMISSAGLLRPLLIGFPLLLIPVAIAIRSGLRPLGRLARELAQRRPGELGPVQVPHVYAELAPVTRELNATVAKLRELLQMERDFLAEAAHELRTPLALIAAQADTLIHAETSGERTDAARRLAHGMKRARRLVTQVLVLARLNTNVEAVIRRTDIADVTRDVLAAHDIEADNARVDLSYLGPDNFVVEIPGDAFESLLANLISNSIRYSRPGGRVEVVLATGHRDAITLLVRDDGPGIPEDERGRVFERFRRGRGAKAPGSGLGLSIVASAAKQLGASVRLRPGIEGKGIEFEVQWHPLSASY